MNCADCGKPLIPFVMGAYRRCCSGLGYWHDQPPTPDDIRAMIQTMPPKCQPKQYRGWWNYHHPLHLKKLVVPHAS